MTKRYYDEFNAAWDDIPGAEEEEGLIIEDGVYVDELREEHKPEGRRLPPIDVDIA